MDTSFISRQHRRRGFTLLELMVTIGIIAILAALVTLTLVEQRRAARDANRQLAVGEYTTSLEQYYAQNHTYMVMPSGCTIAPGPDVYPGATIDFQLPVGTGSNCAGYHGGGWGSLNRKYSESIMDYGTVSIADALRTSGFLQKISTDPRTKGDFPTEPASYFKNPGGPGLANFDDYILTLCTSEGKPAENREQATEFGLFVQLERNPQDLHKNEASSKQSCGGPETGYGWDTIQ